MKIQPKNTSKTKLFIIAFAVIIVAAASYAGIAYYTKLWPFIVQPQALSNKNTETANKSITNTGDTTTDPQTDQPPKTPDNNPAEKTKHYDVPAGEETPKNTLTGVINYKNVVDGKLTIRTTIDQLVSSGTCKLTLTHSQTGKTITKTANIIANPSSSACNGFAIPASELADGAWNITINLASNDKQGTLKTTVDI